MPTRDQIVQLCDDYLAAVSAADVEAVVALFAPDAHQEDPVGSPANVGHDAIRAFFTASAEVPLRATRYGPVTVMGNRAVFQVLISMPTPDGEFQMLFADVVTVDDQCRITELLGFADGEADLTDAPGARQVLG